MEDEISTWSRLSPYCSSIRIKKWAYLVACWTRPDVDLSLLNAPDPERQRAI